MELQEVLRLHKMWISSECGGVRADLTRADLIEANLTEADLARADLIGANLKKANLLGANLTEADLTEANIDFASWPLWCGSLKAKIDKRLAVQLAYHFCAVTCNDPDVIAAQNTIYTLANQFHKSECVRLGQKELPK